MPNDTAFRGRVQRRRRRTGPDEDERLQEFEMRGVRGDLYAGNGMALFPRKDAAGLVSFLPRAI